MLKRILGLLGWLGVALVFAAVAIRFLKPEWPEEEVYEVALKYVLSDSRVHVANVGMRWPEEVDKNVALAREMVAAGELGEIVGFRGIHAEDYMRDASVPWNWRVDPRGGSGAVADLGSHIIGLARFLLGPIEALSADLETVVKDRPAAPGVAERKPVEVDDIARLVVRFERVQVIHVERIGLAGVGTFHVHNFNHALGHMLQWPLTTGLKQHCITGPQQSLHQWYQLAFLQHRLPAGDLD